MKFAGPWLLLLFGMGLAFFRNRVALVLERAAHAILGAEATRWSMRLVALTLGLVVVSAVVALVFLLLG
jgi:hypothetical protein